MYSNHILCQTQNIHPESGLQNIIVIFIKVKDSIAINKLIMLCTSGVK